MNDTKIIESNFEDIIEIDRGIHFRITDNDFEYKVLDHSFFVPIKDLRRVSYLKPKVSDYQGGCFFIFSIILFLIKGLITSDYQAHDLADSASNSSPNYKGAELKIRYKDPGHVRWKSKSITYPSLTEEHAKKVIRILKMKNKNLP